MNLYSFTSALPIIGVFFGTIAILFFAFEIGYRLSGKHRESTEGTVLAGTISSALLALLALTLALSFGFSLVQHAKKSSLVMDESNALQTAFLRADYLPQPQKSIIKDLLKEYTALRLKGIDPNSFEFTIQKSEDIQTKLWAEILTLADQKAVSPTTLLMIQSLNEIIELHSKRLMRGIRQQIPLAVWNTIYLLTFLTLLALGLYAGLQNSRYFFATLTLITVYSVMIFLILDLDNPLGGLISVQHEPLMRLYEWVAQQKT